MNKILIPLLELLSVISFSQNAFIKDSIDNYVVREMQKWTIPGVAVAVIKDGKVMVLKGYGVREVGKQEKVDENTLFMIASNSKAFTGTSLALLQYQKRLSLDDKVVKYIPEFSMHDSLATREATIRDMLTHRIGFQTFQSDFLNWGGNLSRKEIIMNMRNVKPVYSFRAKYGYCNAGFLTAGEIIPVVTDTTWDDFVKEHFFLPLNMRRSSTRWETIYEDRNACKPYTLVDEKLTRIPFVNVDNLGPAASINSCAKDLSNWLLMQLDSGKFNGKQVVPYDVLKETRSSNMIVGNGNSASATHFVTYGLGWFMNDYMGRKIIRHNGGADGFVTTTCYVPEENLGIVVLTNTDANDFYNALRQQILDAYLGVPYKNYSDISYKANRKEAEEQEKKINQWKELAAKKNNADLDLQTYCGTYKNSVYGKMEVKREKEKIVLYFEHHPDLKGLLEALGENDFLCTYSNPVYGIKKISFKVRDKKVQSVTVTVNDFIDYMEYEFVKE